MTFITKILKSTGVYFLIVGVVSMAACGGASSSSSTEAEIPFPSDIAIAPPTEGSPSTSLSTRSFAEAKASIDSIRTATDIADCAPDISAMLQQGSDNPSCYGPILYYVGHPEGTPGDGELPPGDLGIWKATEGTTGEACAAAKLNSAMGRTENQINAALMILASMVCTIQNDASVTTSSVDISAAYGNMLTNAGVTTITADTATYSKSGTQSDYEITLNAEIPSVGDPSAMTDTTIIVGLTHIETDGTTYNGRLYYSINGAEEASNCNNPANFGADVTSNVTYNGSLVYNVVTDASTSTATVELDARSGTSCDANNTNPLDTNHVFDPSVVAEMGDITKGWADSATILRADFSPITRTGNYAFAWQAGAQDGSQRTIITHLEDNDSDGFLDGVAYFGFGEDLKISSNPGVGVTKMACNWAGPNGLAGETDSSQFPELCQKQEIEENASGTFEPTLSAISYAPTLNCNATADDHFGYGLSDPPIVLAADVTNDLVDISDIIASSYVAPSALTWP